MTTLQKTLVGAILVAAIGAGIYETRQASILREQQASLAEQMQRLSRERNEAMRQLAASRDEYERLKRDTADLLRLRGEVSRLRQELVESRPQKPAPVAAVPPNEAEQPPEPVQIFVGNADATVPAGQTLALGGWATSPGKRTIVFVQPKIVDARNADHLASILLGARLAEVPDETLAKLVSEFNLGGLNQLRAQGKASSAQSLFTADDAALILKTLEQSAGVDVLSEPRIQTSEGVQAILTTGQQKIVEGVEHTLGPSLDVEPRLAADGSSVNLTVSVRLKIANPAQPTAP